VSLVEVALAKEAGQRFATAQHMIGALDAAFASLDPIA
jgi:hypothetical protein